MRTYDAETKRRLIRLFRNAITAIKTDTIREPHHMGFIVFLLERITTEDSDNPKEDHFQFVEGSLDPDPETEAFKMLIKGWKNPVQRSAGLLEHAEIEAG